MAAWTQGNITANGIEIHYTRTGGNKPPLVLAHGFTDHGMCWVCVAQALETTHELIMLDARGHGQSGRIHQPYSTDDMAHDVLAAMDVLRLERPGLFGHSMGASTAAVVAAIAPERIAYAILEDPPWFDPPPNVDDDAEEGNAWEKQLLEIRSRSFEEALARVRAENPLWHEDELTPWVESKMQLDMRIFHDIHQNSRFFNWREVIPHIQCSVMLLTGDPARGGVVKPEVAQAVADASTRVRWVQIANAGHCVHRDQFEESMAAIRAFLEEHSPSSAF